MYINDWEPTVISHISQLPFGSRIDFIRSKLPIFLLMYPLSHGTIQAHSWAAQCPAADRLSYCATGSDFWKRLGTRPGCKAELLRPAALSRLVIPDTWAEKFESFEQINSIREINESFDTSQSFCSLHVSNWFVRWDLFTNLSVQNFWIFSAHVSGVTVSLANRGTVRRHIHYSRPRSLSTAGLRVTGPRWPARGGPAISCLTVTLYTWAEKFESFERINSIRETNGNFDSCNSCKRLVPSRLHELHESKFPFVSRIEFIRSKLSNFSAHVYGDSVTRTRRYPLWPRREGIAGPARVMRLHATSLRVKILVAWRNLASSADASTECPRSEGVTWPDV